ncbi:hypothetical protein EUZ85_27320 [Hahella sp. KA22]|uniref:hypothetical protein n=1 Tax=Hahella sp. KA22 TaxID=1628392 RepID=UPI000FDD5DD3|nr:hypothetical protein [Hahella sp. KA22]AZZ94229.1 hypothetical protein ENC22_24735 [Hahella sp. KA22]QAY57603.1 hypothetical protein EUZ85_27320 [Hahella sp. KA22]
MLRVLIDKLTEKNGILLYKHEVFTGVAFTRLSDGHVRGDVVVNGKVEEEYKNVYWSNIASSDIYLDMAFLEIDKEPVSYKGKPLSGNVFDFDRGFCVEEKYYSEGVLIHEANWTFLGGIEFLMLQENDLSQEYVWRNGAPVSLELYSEDNFNFRIGLGDTGRVYAILAKGNYFEKANSLQGRVGFDLWRGREWFEMQSISDRLAIMGDASDDKLLRYIKKTTGYENISSLVLDDSSISAESILSFSELKLLDSFDVRDVRPEIRDVMIAFKITNKECRVVCNREVIVELTLH